MAMEIKTLAHIIKKVRDTPYPPHLDGQKTGFIKWRFELLVKTIGESPEVTPEEWDELKKICGVE